MHEELGCERTGDGFFFGSWVPCETKEGCMNPDSVGLEQCMYMYEYIHKCVFYVYHKQGGCVCVCVWVEGFGSNIRLC